MKEENKDLYRIDPLKVKRKIFELYPPGSRQREDMIKEDKLNELEHLNTVISCVPREATDSAITNIKSMSVILFIKAVFFASVSLGLAFLMVVSNLSALEVFISIAGFIIFSYMSLKSVVKLYLSHQLVKTFVDNVQELDIKMKKLKKDIFDDTSR